MILLDNIVKRLLKILSLKHLIDVSGVKMIVPLYHVVSDDKLDHIKNLYHVKGIAEFCTELDFLCRHFKSISSEDMLKYNAGFGEKKKPGFHLTFDDGLKEIKTIIAPILIKRNIHATFFITSAFVNNKVLFYRFKASLLVSELQKNEIPEDKLHSIASVLMCGDVKSIPQALLDVNYSNKYLLDEVAKLIEYDFEEFLKKQPFMDEEDIEWLIGQGFTIGAHSIDHPNYQHISLQEQINQTNSSLDYIKERFKITESLFAFPFTDLNVRYEYFNHPRLQKNSSFGTGGLRKGKFSIQRIPMEIGRFEIEQIIKGHYLKLIFRKILGRNNINR